MKILLVSFYYYPELGAAPSRITNMAEGFIAEGAEVDVLTCLPNYPKGRIFDGYRGRLYKKEKTGKGTIFRYWTYATVSKNPMHFAAFFHRPQLNCRQWPQIRNVENRFLTIQALEQHNSRA